MENATQRRQGGGVHPRFRGGDERARTGERAAKPYHLKKVPRGPRPDELARGLFERLTGDAECAGKTITLKAYTPASWFHPRGVLKVLRRFWHRLPDVSGNLFLTFTLDPKLFEEEDQAFEQGRDRLRRIFHRLRQGREHEGKFHQIDAPYCVKVEFHKNGWAHFHVIFLTRRYVPVELLKELWGLGRVNVQRINTRRFHYLLKYVCKPGDLPAWVAKRKRVRVFQPSRGFLKPEAGPCREKAEDRREEGPENRRTRAGRASFTIGERLERWARMATTAVGERFRSIHLSCRFRETLDQLVLSVALAGRYQGNGKIRIDEWKELMPWLSPRTEMEATAA